MSATKKASAKKSPKKKAPPAGELLATWAGDGAAPVEEIVLALATGDDSVDAFLSGPAKSNGFAPRLLDEYVFEIGLALDEAPPIPEARWLALARLDPRMFAWNLEPENVLPLSEPSISDAFAALLLETLGSRENRSVLLRWLSHPSFLGDEDAIGRMQAALARSGAALTWADRLDTVKILARRGGPAPGARALEHLLRHSTPDATDAIAIHKSALALADATLLGVLSGFEPWASSPDLCRELAQHVSTDELIEAFAPLNGEARARRAASNPGSARRAAWFTLAQRPERRATDTVGRLIVRCAVFLGDESLAAGLCAALIAARGDKAVTTLVAGFLSGLHRRAPGLSIERLLRLHPLTALKASLDLQPDWVHTYEPDAMTRLAFRVLPKLTAVERAEIAAEARLQGSARAHIVLDEIEAL